MKINPSRSIMEVTGIVDRIIRQDDRLLVFCLKQRDTLLKIIDTKCTLEGIRVCDNLHLSVNTPAPASASASAPTKAAPTVFGLRKLGTSETEYIFVELLGFNRPFSPQQIVHLLRDCGQKAVDDLINGNKIEPIIELLKSQNWEAISAIIGKKSPQIIKQLKIFHKETRNFLFLTVNRALMNYDRCQLNDADWERCQKMFNELLQSGKLNGLEVINFIENAPYSLILDGHIKSNMINFQIIDQIARHGAFGKTWTDSLESRQLVGLWCLLRDHLKQTGNSYMKLDTLVRQAKVMLGKLTPKIESKLTTAVIYRINGGSSSNTQSIIYPKYVDDLEHLICDRITDMVAGEGSLINKIETSVEDILRIDPELDATQVDIVSKVINNSIAIITGPPGVGKTRILSVIIKLLKQKMGRDILISAPTGMACKNISKALSLTDGSPVHTIAKLLYFSSSLDKDKRDDVSSESGDDNDDVGTGDSDDDNLSAGGAGASAEKRTCLLDEIVDDNCGIVIDETSMVDVCQFEKLLRHLPKHNFRLILVGDHNQLPSIGMGQLLLDLINSNVVPIYKMETNYRQQKKGSTIRLNAANVLAGSADLKDGCDYTYFPSFDDDTTIDLLCKMINQLKSKCSLDDCIILTAFSEKGKLCSRNLNHVVKHLFIEDRSVTWANMAVGDRVMQTKNIHKKQLVNGDIGIIRSMTFDRKILKHMMIEYVGTNGLTKYDKQDVVRFIQLAYAISIHKSQGSGYPFVILIIPSNYSSTFLNRNMIYTAITRAKKHLFVIGGDISDAIKTPLTQRSTRLALRLRKSVTELTQSVR